MSKGVLQHQLPCEYGPRFSPKRRPIRIPECQPRARKCDDGDMGDGHSNDDDYGDGDSSVSNLF